ncbi:alpha/beta fold hydrolase, partial [Streptomyces silvisoli]
MARRTTTKGVGRFTSDAAWEKFLAAYDDAMGLWPCPREELVVETSFATTHVHRCGPDNGEPIVLLHGSGGSSTMWFPNVAALSARHRVYAIDTPGDPGRSMQRQPIFEPEVSSVWLDEVLDALGVTQAHLIGSSYGGWLALNQTLHSPGRVATSTLLDPGGLEKVGVRFYTWMIINGLVLQSQLWGVASAFVVAAAGSGLAEASPPRPAQMMRRSEMAG